MKPSWTSDQVKQFSDWHDHRMVELKYPPAVVDELTKARWRWLPPILENMNEPR